MRLTRIPERYRPGLARIAKLSSAQVEELAKGLEGCPATADFAAFTSSLHVRLYNWARKDLNSVVRTLYSLSAYLADEDTSIDQLTKQVIDVMRTSDDPTLVLTDQSEPNFAQAMKRLLGIKSLTFAAKALGLRSDYEKLFCDAKIITDIRSVFDNVTDKPTGALVSNLLKLEFHELGEHKEFYVYLGRDSISKLRRILERAEKKTASLRTLIADVGITDLDR